MDNEDIYVNTGYVIGAFKKIHEFMIVYTDAIPLRNINRALFQGPIDVMVDMVHREH